MPDTTTTPESKPAGGIGLLGWIGLATVAVIGFQAVREAKVHYQRKKLDDWVDYYEKRSGKKYARHWHARGDSDRGIPLPR